MVEILIAGSRYIALRIADGRDDSNGRGFGIDYADGHFICDNAGNGFYGNIAGDGNHIETHRTHGGHGFKFFKRKGTVLSGADHAGIFGDGDKCSRKTADAG